MIIRQTDKSLDENIQKYGCYFLSLAHCTGKEFTASQLNFIWTICIDKGYINGDINGDGDMDDSNEAVIVNPNGVCRELGLLYKYVDKHISPHEAIPEGYLSIGRFYNRRTRHIHFVVINKYKTVIFDPIPNSVTVKEGVLDSMRLYRPV